jgi:tetratricopeptide (TPR) repeat protein
MIYEQAAQKESDAQKKADLLLKAGLAHTTAGELTKAENAWRRVVAEMPKDPQAYQHLATAIYGAKKDLRRAEDVVAEGIKNGASPFSLYLSLAEAAHKADRDDAVKAALNSAKGEIDKAARTGEDPYALYLLLADAAARVRSGEEEKAALLAALNLRPRSSTTLLRLANLYLQEQKFDRAALYYGKIANINPYSADVHYQLAVAEEGRYHFAAADKAFARALELAPGNKEFKDRYNSLRRKVAAERKN